MSTQNNDTWIFTGALFVVAQTCKQQKHPARDEWINKLWSIHTVENFWAIEQTTGACSTMDENQNDYGDWKKPDK